ncbi:hypothetical protein IE077_003365 [Cardiosporidium cionae]|uniref:Uncharacterized protein n=1 Tax=Cardiosporidium cionae TaxID=476202 RepID=A0ABQ7JF18_9APIC|nr:hypothetical protein IE077_003365 [Cardiosporidium cionae]|eukprot:KAF8822605.1 hypothetical protein IE077_003365 [Cardiosporidium cionae]
MELLESLAAWKLRGTAAMWRKKYCTSVLRWISLLTALLGFLGIVYFVKLEKTPDIDSTAFKVPFDSHELFQSGSKIWKELELIKSVQIDMNTTACNLPLLLAIQDSLKQDSFLETYLPNFRFDLDKTENALNYTNLYSSPHFIDRKCHNYDENYLLVRVPSLRDSGTESIMLTFVFDPEKKSSFIGLAIGITIAKYLSKCAWLSKDIYVIFSSNKLPYSAATRSLITSVFLDPYLNMPRASNIRAALVFDISESDTQDVRITMGIFLTQKLYDEIIRMAFNGGIESHHTPFSQHAIDALTVHGVAPVTDQFVFLFLYRSILRIVRILSSFSESIHHSTRKYLMTSIDGYVEIGLLLGISISLILPLAVKVFFSKKVNNLFLVTTGIATWFTCALIGSLPSYLVATGYFSKIPFISWFGLSKQSACMGWNTLHSSDYSMKAICWLMMLVFCYTLAAVFLHVVVKKFYSTTTMTAVELVTGRRCNVDFHS